MLLIVMQSKNSNPTSQETLVALHPRLDFHGYNISSYVMDAIERYYYDRLPPGGFTTAILAGDYEYARAKADYWNLNTFDEIVRWLEEQCPRFAWGSYEIVEDWLMGDKK